MKRVVYYFFIFGVTHLFCADDQKLITNDPLAAEIGLTSSLPLLAEDDVAQLLSKHLPKGSKLKQKDIKNQLSQLPSEDAHVLLGKIIKRSKDDAGIGARAQLVLHLLSNQKSRSDAYIAKLNEEYRQDLEQSERIYTHILSQKNIENWTSLFLTAVITGILTWGFGANC
jgi:hypothetical protein